MPTASSSDLYHILPFDYPPCASELFLKLAHLGKRIWLDSGIEAHQDARFDILSAAPIAVLSNPSIEALEEAHARYFPEALKTDATLQSLPFTGGIVGYFNYEYAHREFNLPTQDDPREKQLASMFGVYNWALIIDHEKQEAFLIFLSSCEASLRALILDTLSGTPAPHKEFTIAPFEEDTSYEQYQQDIQRIHEHILDGDAYQINYAQRFNANFSGATDTAYCQLRETLPGPFSAYIELKSHNEILSFSPERFISVENNIAETKPIKGTIARGKTQTEDEALAQTLRSSEKNKAENVMIVDLLRNDFSKSCKPFSVKVEKLCDLESFKNVHHLVSTIRGELQENISTLQFFMHCFPGGSITGAPKKRSMEIIHSLEKHPRNSYCGSICYYSAHGKFDSNIAIRTLYINEGKIYCWGGGGIVIDSETKEEYDESRQKISSLMDALNKKARKN